MKKVDLKITIDSNSRRIEYILIENRNYPSSFFNRENGEWVGEIKDLQIGDDNDLDIIIIVAGNPGLQSEMEVIIDNDPKGKFKMYKPFNRNGYGQFNEEI